MSKKEYEKTQEIAGTKYQVKITINKAYENRYILYGRLLDADGIPVPGINIKRKNARSLLEAKQRIPNLRYELSCKIPSEHKTNSLKPDTHRTKNPIDRIVEDMLENNTVFYNADKAGSQKRAWNPDTHRTVYSYWLNHKLADLLYKMDESDDPKQVLEVFRNELIQKTVNHGRSRGNLQRATMTVNINLNRMTILLKHLRKEHPEIPDVDLTTGIVMGIAVPEEQVKYLPEPMCQYFRAELEAHLPYEPEKVLCAVLMYDGALRTAEAAGIRLDSIIIYDNYAVVKVISQEKNGRRINRLKTDNAYRYVVLSYWAKKMTCRCMDLIHPDPDDDSPLIRAEHLSHWIRRILQDFDPKFIEDAEQVQRRYPDYDDEGKAMVDDSAYVLRRNAASRWLNYAGLTHDEVDIMLGHKEKGQRPEIYLMDEAHQQSIAAKLERYVHNPEASKNPAYCPLELAPDHRLDQDAGQKNILINSTDKPMRVHIDAIGCAPGSIITLRVPANSAKAPICRCDTLKPASRIVFNTNLDTFKGDK